MKKILFHHNCLEQGGAERVVSNLSNQFAKDGYEVIVATEWEGENEFKLDERVRRIHVGLEEKDENKKGYVKAIIRVINLRKLIKKEKPDVTIGFTRKPLYRLLMATLGIKTPVIIAVRTDPKGHYDERTDKLLIPLLFPRVDGAVFQTEGQRDFFPKYIREKSTIILNPVSDKYLNVQVPEVKEKTIVHSGRLVDFKNQPMLIRAFLKVHEKYPEYSLLIYGPDSFDGTKEILEDLIAKNNAAGYIKLMGGSDELEKLLPKGEIYAFSSDWEGLPNALLEAMCLKMPIVATDCPCGGPRTVMTDGVDGILVPVGDEDVYADALCRLIENPDEARKMGENAGKIAERIKGEAIIEQWKDYILSVINKKN